MQTQARDIHLRFDREARPLKEDELDDSRELFDVFPKMKIGELVATDNPVELIVRVLLTEKAGRIDRIAHPAPAEFDVRNLKAVIPFDGRPQHREPVFAGRLDIGWLKRCLSRRNQHEAIEFVLFKSVLRGEQMPKMNGVEAPAKESNFHWRAT